MPYLESKMLTKIMFKHKVENMENTCLDVAEDNSHKPHKINNDKIKNMNVFLFFIF